jgi:2-amino-4-hydroxy-6-hydroxymethyldihydropteridine diphosphokinase
MARAGLSVVVILGFGANLGDRAAALCGAVGSLGAHGIAVERVSPLYESEYVGPGAPQPPYLNAVAVVRTGLVPLALLHVLGTIEAAHGRAPGTHGRPRPLDLDLLYYGRWRVVHPRLVVPHPRLGERRFVLEPLADLGLLAGDEALGKQLERLRQTQVVRRWGTLDRVGERCEARVA